MSNSNIEKFNVLAAQVLADLYQSFPIPRELACAQFGFSSEYNKNDAPCEELIFFMSSVRWLGESGYIRYSKENTILFWDAVLTAKGLETLCSMPDSLSPGKTLGERLKDAADSGSKTVLAEAIKIVLATGVRLAVGAAT
jgi:hypothetical protein